MCTYEYIIFFYFFAVLQHPKVLYRYININIFLALFKHPKAQNS